MAKLEYIFDFGSPNAYLVHKVLSDVIARSGAELELSPCLLGGIFKASGNQPPMLAFANVSAKLAYEQLEMQRFIDKHRLTAFKFNEYFPVNTLLMMRGAVAAQQSESFPAYLDACYAAMWERSLKMDDPEIFTSVLDDAGLDGAALLTQTQDPAVKAQLLENTNAAVLRGVFGVPTFFVGDEMFFGKERLAQVEEALAR